MSAAEFSRWLISLAPYLRVIEVSVVGNINEALDIWYEHALLLDLSSHSHLVLINAGAYSSSMASNHCMRGQYKEFLLF